MMAAMSPHILCQELQKPYVKKQNKNLMKDFYLLLQHHILQLRALKK